LGIQRCLHSVFALDIAEVTLFSSELSLEGKKLRAWCKLCI
jgi:hypothetical protein